MNDKKKIFTYKWRPLKFKNFIGQDNIIKILKICIKIKKLHHSYLFVGPSGVGKTSLSRLFVKSLNCILGITYKFCNICNNCKSIDMGKFVDHLEIDAASNRGVEEISFLLKNIYFLPIVGRYKVYTIDEFHMLSNHAFSLMLKLLESPPKYVKFILITTNFEKIPPPILSRCINFNFKNISFLKTILYITKILIKEKIFYKKNALFLISRFSNGNLRDAVSLIEQACYYTNNKIFSNLILQMLCIIDEFYILKLLFFILNNMNNLIINIANDIKQNGLSFMYVLFYLINIIHKIFLLQCCSDIKICEYKYKKILLYFANIINPEKILIFYKIALSGYNDLKLYSDKYIIFTITLLKMVLFKFYF